GILAPTGTPIDRSLMVSLEAIEAIHEGSSDADALRASASRPATVTAVFVGARSPILTFGLQRFLNGYDGEPISAVLPGVAFAQLWSIVGQVETALLAISGMVVITACIGLAVAMLSSLEGRRREMAILRAVGAGPSSILTLFLFEALLVTVGGILLGLALTYGTLALLLPVLESRLGISLSLSAPSLREWLLFAAVGSGGIIAGLIPAWRATRMSLADGLTVRA
ncbi:FtsX-like permease family protein, partial [Rhizobiaceae bacterium]|nr:FtsX-like permease family protein [Rhizobiaceae bacterium]